MIEGLLKALDEKELEYFKNNMHDEFVYVDDFTMEIREQWLESFEASLRGISDGFFKNQREIMLDCSDITTSSFAHTIDVVDYRFTNVGLLKDAKFWRQIVNRVPV